MLRSWIDLPSRNVITTILSLQHKGAVTVAKHGEVTFSIISLVEMRAYYLQTAF